MVKTSDLRNIALVGHGNSGKTSAAEALLFKAKVTSRWGKVDEGNSFLDYLDDEKEKGYSINSAMGRLEWQKRTFNIIDTPGKPDFIGQVAGALPVVETAVITIAANGGVQVNTRNTWKMAEAAKCARAILITKIEAENVRLEDVLNQIVNSFGDRCIPVNYPKGEGGSFEDVYSVVDLKDDAPDAAKSWRDTLIERAVEADEEVMAEFLETMELSDEKLKAVLKKAVANGVVVPIMFASLMKDKGYEQFADFAAEYFPSPEDLRSRRAVYNANDYKGYLKSLKATPEEESEAVTEEGAEGEAPKPGTSGRHHKLAVPPDPVAMPGGFVAQVFKVAIDQHVGRFSFLRVWNGELASDANFTNAQSEKSEKSTGFNVVTAGNERGKIDRAVNGDIVMLVKMESLHLNDTITDGSSVIVEHIKFPEPMVARAIFPKTQKDIDRLGDALRKTTDEDPCVHDHVDKVTKERVLNGTSDMHLQIILERLKARYKVEVDTQIPKVPYNETCTASANGSFRHKKQSGGSGEFAEVHIEIGPTERGKGVEFEDAIVGGAIDRVFIPAVEKGVRDQCTFGVLAGFPVVDVHVKLYDGKTHPVDSKDRAFQKAGREAFKEIFPKCKPKLLEPYMEMEVTVPADNVGDILADISGRCRGRVLEQTQEGNFTTLKAHVPLAEVQTYSQTLQSVTGGEGFYTLAFSHYDIVPDTLTQSIVAKYKKEAEDKD